MNNNKIQYSQLLNAIEDPNTTPQTVDWFEFKILCDYNCLSYKGYLSREDSKGEMSKNLSADAKEALQRVFDYLYDELNEIAVSLHFKPETKEVKIYVDGEVEFTVEVKSVKMFEDVKNTWTDTFILDDNHTEKIEIGDTVITKSAFIVNENKTFYPGNEVLVVRKGVADDSFVVQFKEEPMTFFSGHAVHLPTEYTECEFHKNLLTKK